MAHDLAQPSPAVRLGAIDGAAYAGRPESEQRLRRLAIVPRHERDGGNRGKLANEPRDAWQCFAMTAMHGNDHGVDAMVPRDVQGFAQGIRVQRVEAAIAGCVDAWTFVGGGYRTHRYHAAR